MPRSRGSKLLILFCLLAAVVSQTAIGVHAQDGPHRKAIKTVAPKYPEEFAGQQLGGTVHLSVVVAPDGNVKSVKPISVNRALVDAGIEAVKQWKFEPADTTDTIAIEFRFDPTEN